MKNTMREELASQILSTFLANDNTLISRIKDEQGKEYLQISWIEKINGINVRRDYAFLCQVIGISDGETTDEKIFYSKENEIIRYNDKALLRYQIPSYDRMSEMTLIEGMDFSTHQRIPAISISEQQIKEFFNPISSPAKRKEIQ